MKFLIKSLKLSAVIIGSIIGAGFLSGKEVAVFFSGQDPLITCVLIFLAFFLIIFFFLRFYEILDENAFVILKAVLLCGNFIISAGMLSAIDGIFYLQFPVFNGIPVFSIISLLLANVVAINGKSGLEKANCFLIPVIVSVLIITVAVSPNKTLVSNGKIVPNKIISYCGLNLTLVLPLLSRLGANEDKKVLVISSLISALAVSLGLLVIFALISGLDVSLLSSDLPILKSLASNSVIYFVYLSILIIGILTSTFGAYYPLFNFFSNEFWGSVGKILLCVSLFIFSRLTFSEVVGKVYPVFGVCGFIVIIILIFSRFVFPKRKRKSTLPPLKNKELQFPSSRGLT